MKLGVLLTTLFMSFQLFANVSVTIQCELEEKAARTSNHIKTEYTTLSEDGQMSLAVSPSLSMDRGAIYLLALSKGNVYTDAIGDEVGAQYFLTLNRVQNKTKSLNSVKLRGKTQDMLTITARDGQENQVSYRTDQGHLQSNTPKSLQLNYKIKGRRQIKFTCELI